MGMFDSLYIKCPKCNEQIEIQSKSGRCVLNEYTKETLSLQASVGMDGQIIECEKCHTHFRVIIKPTVVLKETKQDINYRSPTWLQIRCNPYFEYYLEEI